MAKTMQSMIDIQKDLEVMMRKLLHRLPETDDMRIRYTDWLKRVGMAGEVLRDLSTEKTVWIPAKPARGSLPKFGERVLLKLSNGDVHVAILKREPAAIDSTLPAYPYWDDPYEPDSVEWEWDDNVSWTRIPN